MARALIVALFAFAGTALADDKKPSKQETPEGAIDEAIRLLEAKDFKGFFENLAPPEERKKTTPEELEKILKEIQGEGGKKIMDKMLFDLKAVKGVKPAMSENETKAVYETEKDGKRVKVTMIKVEKLWYIK